MNIDDQSLEDSSRLLKDNGINFWVCHGTLLGIVRENRILPWDSDIDLAVWSHENNKKEIANIFESNGYKQELFFADPDSLHFYGKGKNVDINFYKKTGDMAVWEGAIPLKGLLNRMVIEVAHILHRRDISGVKLPVNYIKKYLYIFLSKLVLLLKFFLSKKLKRKIHQNAAKRINYIGYSYPVDLLVFKDIDYKGITLQIPVNSERCLELTYGKNWKTPNKKYVWHKDAHNLTKS